MRRRLDQEMVRRGLARTRSEAREAVLSGRVTAAGGVASKPGTLVAPDEPITVAGPARPFASRGGEKLDPVLDLLPISVAERRCLDAGASTGGFTDVLLRRGAAHVVAIDVGYGQLAWKLREDPRVTVMERTNIRTLTRAELPYAADLVVADLSFISLRSVAEPLTTTASSEADLLLLVKPQFEAGREAVGRGGVVTRADAWRDSVERVAAAFSSLGAGALGVVASPLRGPAGNVEFFLHVRKGSEAKTIDLDRVLREVPA